MYKITIISTVLALILTLIISPGTALARAFYNDTNCPLFVEFYNPDDELKIFPCHTAKLEQGQSTDTKKTFFGGCANYDKIDIKVTSKTGILKVKYNNIPNDCKSCEPFDLSQVPIIKELKGNNCRTW